MSLSITKIIIAVIIVGGLGFIIANINNSPEPQASLEQSKIKVGEIWDRFTW